MHTAIRQASRLVETARRDPLGMSFTLLTISMPWPGRARQPRQQLGERLRRALPCPAARCRKRSPRLSAGPGNRARNRRPRRSWRFRRWPSDPRSPGAAPAGRSRGNRLPPAAWAASRPAPRTLRSMEMLSTRAPSGKSIPRKKMSLQPLCVRSMRTGVASRRIGKQGLGCLARQQFGADAQRIVGGMAGAEHPLVAAHRAHAAAHLVGQRLEAQRAVGGGQRAGDGRARPVGGLGRQEDIDGLLEAALQQVGVAGEGNQARRAARWLTRGGM